MARRRSEGRVLDHASRAEMEELPPRARHGRGRGRSAEKKVDLEIVSSKRFDSGAIAYHLEVKR
jgi:hypothetical protein